MLSYDISWATLPGTGMALLNDVNQRYGSSTNQDESEYLPEAVVQALRQYLEERPELQQLLEKLEPNSELKRLAKFIECRFGKTPPQYLLAEGQLKQGLYWNCPVRDLCPGEGIACSRFSFNNTELNAVEVKLMRLLAGYQPVTAIAAAMFLPEGTFNLFKRTLYRKLNVKTRAELREIALLAGL